MTFVPYANRSPPSGNGRGSGFHRGRDSVRSALLRQVPDTPKKPPLEVGRIVRLISRSSISGVDETGPNRLIISKTELVASYNWLDDDDPKIMIPGKPPRWTPLIRPRRLREDSGIFYRDRNASSYPKHPMEPAIVSVMQMQPTPFHIDIVACASTIRNLLRFIRGDDTHFRMLVEVVGDTVHLIRRENSPKETIDGVRGHGHTFPEAYTTWERDVKRSSSHQRIIKYQFAGLDIMVRFEGDGYIKSGKTSAATTDGADILDQLQELQMRRKQRTDSTKDIKDLQVTQCGEVVPQKFIFDLKTRSNRRRGEDVLEQELPRLWVSQIPNFILAYHESGFFNDIQINDVQEKVRDWEQRNQCELSLLASLLHEIIDVVHSCLDSELEIVRQKEGELEVCERTPDAGDAFSATVRAKWAKWLESGASKVEIEAKARLLS